MLTEVDLEFILANQSLPDELVIDADNFCNLDIDELFDLKDFEPAVSETNGLI